MSLPVEGNYTKVRCTNCGATYEGLGEDGKAVGKLPPCEQCGAVSYRRIVINPVCDFCSTPFEPGESCWTYPCDVFVYPFQSEPGTLEWNSGPWSACKDCHGLIEAGDLKALSAYAVAREIAQDPDAEQFRTSLTAMIRALHRAFNEHRTGEPFREVWRAGDWARADG